MNYREISKPLGVPLINKVQRRLADWKGKLLSLGGRITIINAVLYAAPTYFLSFFLPAKMGGKGH